MASSGRGAARRTKIVATVGPASDSPEMLRELIDAGVDVFRLNFAHGTPDTHAENVRRIRSVSEEIGREVGILGDLPGPKLRIGDLEGDVAVLHSGSKIVMRGETNGTPGSDELLTVQWDGFAKALHEGDPVFLADGRVRLRVVSVSGADVVCEVEAGGAVSSHQGVNLPHADTDLPETGASDEPWIDFACEHGIDLLAVSFVRRPVDLEKVEARVRERGKDIPLIAKIDKPQAAERAEEIINAAGSGIMIARGDLGVELPIEEVPRAQKRRITLAGKASKPAITEASSSTSIAMGTAPVSRASASSLSTRRAQAATLAPASAAMAAKRRPRPDEAPVTRTLRPLRSLIASRNRAARARATPWRRESCRRRRAPRTAPRA